MAHLNPEKLHVDLIDDVNAHTFSLPRAYTLTHSDSTGDLFLTIGKSYNLPQISGLYTRFMRDEVLAAWLKVNSAYELHLYCHVSGGFLLGPARWRLNIFRSHLRLVLEAFRYGDQEAYNQITGLDMASAVIHFNSHIKKYDLIENWGTMGEYEIINTMDN